MCLNQFLQGFRSQFQDLLWKDVPEPRTATERDHLEGRLERCSAALVSQHRTLAELRQRLAEKERRAAWLGERVEVYLHVGDRTNAWRHALDLDSLRHRIEHARDELQRRERIY